MFDNELRDKCETLVRRYKRLRLIAREKMRTLNKNGDNYIIAHNTYNTVILKYDDFINGLEEALGYKVHIDPKKQVRPNSIQERLDAIQEE